MKPATAFCVGLLAAAALRAQDWAPNLTLSTTWNDNATNADRSADRIAALQTQADLLSTRRFDFGSSDSVSPEVHLATEWWPRFARLTTASAGLAAGWEHKFGLGALAPVVSVDAAGDLVLAEEAGRRGAAASVTLAVRQRFNDQWRGKLSQQFERLDAHAAVYDRRAAQTTAELSRDLDDVSRLTFAALWRAGDIVSYATPPRPDLVALAPVRQTVDTFRRPLTAYSIDAHTLGGRAELVRAVAPESALILAYEYRDSERGPLRYGNQLVSLTLVHQF